MCGIVGAIAERDVVPILLEGLRRLEYRGYDSAGIATVNQQNVIGRVRAIGKVKQLEPLLAETGLKGGLGIAHTRWATHGKPTESNAHPHICNDEVTLVHNGIIENHEALRAKQTEQGYAFTSETDTETVVHEVHHQYEVEKDIYKAVVKTIAVLEGAFALAVIHKNEPDRLIVARRGSPLVIGIGIGEHFIASDIAAMLPVTNRFIYLEDGDVADISRNELKIFDAEGNSVVREVKHSKQTSDSSDKGPYRHYMMKEIFEQPQAVSDILEGRISNNRVVEASFGVNSKEIFDSVEGVHIIACGTSFHSGMVAKYWLESLAGIPCSVEIASEFRYRNPVVRKNSLVVTLSQSGETADTLAALEEAKRLGFGHTLSICNVPESALVRASDLCLMTRAGPEIGVASTKAFTTQLVALMLLVVVLGRRKELSDADEETIVKELIKLPGKIEEILKASDEEIKELSEDFNETHNALFLGRGTMYPIAMEGALKLKEISYIHAEAYPAGELKHGPLALVDADMPVIVIAPNDELLEKLKSNMHEVYARGGQLIVFADPAANIEASEGIDVVEIGSAHEWVAPILFTIPLQLLSYYVAVLKGTDVDQPRNLAKSVTVE